ncbi:hypothetical protein HDV00_006400 [Rhizophlyctis rosea]|nr:hypothetical protein HDV00_006400 [Rhizophlyctis rosea]
MKKGQTSLVKTKRVADRKEVNGLTQKKKAGGLGSLFTGGAKSVGKTSKVAPLPAQPVDEEESGEDEASLSFDEDQESFELINGEGESSDDDDAQSIGADDAGDSKDVDGDSEPVESESDQETNDQHPTHTTDLSALPDELQQLVQKDSLEYVTLLKDFKNKVADMRGRLAPLLERIHAGDIKTSNGVSLLEVKLHSLLSYITNLGFYTLLKLHGRPISGHPVVDRLIELRIVLEKVKPLEMKLKYQIEKLVRAAGEGGGTATGGGEEGVVEDPLKFRPNPMGLVVGDAAGDAATTTTTEEGKTGVYRPPRVAPKPYNDAQTSRTKTGRLSEAALSRASSSRLLADLRAQYDSRPEEMTAHGTGYGTKEVGASVDDERFAEREKYEEENFMRLSMTREDKRIHKRLEKRGGLARFEDEFDSLDRDFASLSSINRAVEESDELSHGRGVLGKARGVREGVFGSKRKYGDVGELVRERGRAMQSVGGKDEFGREVKRMRRREGRRGK